MNNNKYIIEHEATILDMPYDIDETVYLLKDEPSKNNRFLFKCVKCIVYGYFNFGDGWKIKLRTSRYKHKFDEYDINLHLVGYAIFSNENELKQRVKELGGRLIE